MAGADAGPPRAQGPTTEVTVYYLETLSRPERVVPPPRDGLSVVHARRPTVA